MYIYTLSIHKILHTYFIIFVNDYCLCPLKGHTIFSHHFNSGIRITKCKL